MTEQAPLRVSVVIPTHQRDEFLRRAVRSAAGQSLLPIEIIVVDDLASAETKATCVSLDSEVEPPVIYIENHGRPGAPSSRNLGSRHADAELLAFLDDDDTWDPEYLAQAAKIVADRKLDVVVTGLMNVDPSENETPGKSPPQEFDERAFYLTNPGVLCSNVVILKSAFERLGGYDVSIQGSCDKDLIIQAHRAGMKYGVNEERLVNWHTHGAQWSVDDSRLLPSVVRFYRKYFFSMPPLVHVRLWYKIFKLSFSRYSKR